MKENNMSKIQNPMVVDAGALQMIRNAMTRPAGGSSVRREMLAELDAATVPFDEYIGQFDNDAVEDLNCAETILDGYAAHMDLEETGFLCIGDYIKAVVDPLLKDAERWKAVRQYWTKYNAGFRNNHVRTATITVDFDKVGAAGDKFIARDFDEAIERNKFLKENRS